MVLWCMIIKCYSWGFDQFVDINNSKDYYYVYNLYKVLHLGHLAWLLYIIMTSSEVIFTASCWICMNLTPDIHIGLAWLYNVCFNMIGRSWLEVRILAHHFYSSEERVSLLRVNWYSTAEGYLKKNNLRLVLYIKYKQFYEASKIVLKSRSFDFLRLFLF